MCIAHTSLDNEKEEENIDPPKPMKTTYIIYTKHNYTYTIEGTILLTSVKINIHVLGRVTDIHRAQLHLNK